MTVLIIQPIRYMTKRKWIGSCKIVVAVGGGGDHPLRLSRNEKVEGLERNERDAPPVGEPRINVLFRQRLGGSECG